MLHFRSFSMDLCVSVCIFVCICISVVSPCMYVCIYRYIHIHTHTCVLVCVCVCAHQDIGPWNPFLGVRGLSRHRLSEAFLVSISLSQHPRTFREVSGQSANSSPLQGSNNGCPASAPRLPRWPLPTSRPFTHWTGSVGC